MARPSVTSQLSQLERESSASKLSDDTDRRSEARISRHNRRAVTRYAAGLKYWRDISWPSFFFSLFLLTMARISGPASEKWTVNEFNHVLYRYPMVEKETVPTWAFLVWIFASAFLLLFLEVYLVRSVALKARVIMGLNTGMAMLEGFFYTVVFTELGKFWIGEPRPDYVERCLGSPDADATFDDNGVMVCTQQIGSNARESFPSGHSSTTFSCGVFLSAYLIWTVYFRHVDLPWRSASRQWYSQYGMMVADTAYLLCFWPVGLAAFVAASRVHDHRHSPADVAAGAILGILFGGLLFARLLSRDHHTRAASLSSRSARLVTPMLGSSSASRRAAGAGGASERDVFPSSSDSDSDEALSGQR